MAVGIGTPYDVTADGKRFISFAPPEQGSSKAGLGK